MSKFGKLVLSAILVLSLLSFGVGNPAKASTEQPDTKTVGQVNEIDGQADTEIKDTTQQVVETKELATETISSIKNGDFKVNTAWYYKGKLFDVSRFMDTTADVKVVDGKTTFSFNDISEIITGFKINGESINISNGVAIVEVGNAFSDATGTIEYQIGERKMSHDFEINFSLVDGQYSLGTVWYYNGKEFDVSRFMETPATLKVADGKNIVTINNVSSIIKDFKINDESLTVVDGVADFAVDKLLSGVKGLIGYNAGGRGYMSHEFDVKFTSLNIKSETEEPVTEPKEPVTETEKPVTETKIPFTITGEGAMGEFITSYLAPYIKTPATVKDENGQKYAYITLTGKMYGAKAIQVIKADGTKEDVQVVSSIGEGLEQVRVIKFALNGDTTRLYVESGDYGNYTIQLKFDYSVEKPGAGTNNDEKTTHTKQTLKNEATGIQLAGNLLSGVKLNVGEISEEAKAKFKSVAGNKEILGLFEVSLSDTKGFDGKLTLTFPVDAKYNDKKVKVLHYYDNNVDEHSTVVTNGTVTITVDHLSPFAIVLDETTTVNNTSDASDTNKGNVNPKTSDKAQIGFYIVLLVGSLFVLIRKFRTRSIS